MTRRFISTVALAAVLAVGALAQPVHLKYSNFDPGIAVPVVPAQLRAVPSPNLRYLVQFQGQISDAKRSAILAAGGQIEGYVPEYTLVVRTSNPAAIAALQGVRWAGPFQPAYKLSSDLGLIQYRDFDRIGESLRGVRRMSVTLFDAADLHPAYQSATAAGLEVLDTGTMGPRWVMVVRGTLSGAQQLAMHPDVSFIDEEPELTLRNDVTRWVIQSNVTNQTPVWDRGIRGEEEIVGVIDTRIRMTHDQFRDLANNTVGPNHRKVIAYWSSTGLGADSHGTHVAGTIAGDQEPVTGSTFRNGVAYRARIVHRRLGDVNTANLYQFYTEAHNAGARVHTNSWGNDGTTSYTAHCQAIDQYSWDNEEGMVAFAVTNTSTLKTPENAKSVLGVGSTSQAPNQQNHASGGTGPTSDGRRKPEIYAPGAGIISASNSGGTGEWRSSSGTSMACPSITGAAALVRQYYREGWVYNGTKSPGFSFIPSGALLRATLMNGAVDMTGVAGYPSAREGWGRLLLDNALFFTGQPRRTMVWDIRNGAGLITGQQRIYQLAVSNSSHPLKITMSFTDYPALAFASFAPVNDMDLEVTDPNGVTYFGNVINTSTGQSVPGGAKDAINSTEMVILDQAPTGTYIVRVRSAAVNQGARQGFAVVATGAIYPPSRTVGVPR